MKTFVVKILTSEGLEHHQLIADEDDVTILMEVIKKIERRANKLKAEVQEEASKISSNAALAVTSDSSENKKESEAEVCPQCGGGTMEIREFTVCKEFGCKWQGLTYR